MVKKAWMSWSSGKDSAFALLAAQSNSDIEVTCLLTTVNQTYKRVAMHAVRDRLLGRQAEELGLPIYRVNIPVGCTNEKYLESMNAAISDAKKKGVTHMIFGDLFLEDVRKYREDMLSGTILQPIFPLWQRPTKNLAEEMIKVGQRAIITCVDPKKLPKNFVGREFDLSFLKDLPEGVDPCGENGEFHSFVYDSPLFKDEIKIEVGEIVERDGFIFADIQEVPTSSKPSQQYQIDNPRCGPWQNPN